MRIHNLLTAGLLLGASTAFAQSSISVEEVKCLPTGKNAVVRATASGVRPGETPRLYFRWKERGSFYWVEMEPETTLGRYWGVPPKAEDRNEEVEYYATLVDASGRETARSASRRAPVRDNDCQARLTAAQAGVAETLTIGATAATQEGKEVLGFLCDGIVTRVNAQGIRRADETCRACVVAWWRKPAVLIPAAATVTGIIIADDDGPTASEDRPRRP
jgi:hypothetical protein